MHETKHCFSTGESSEAFNVLFLCIRHVHHGSEAINGKLAKSNLCPVMHHQKKQICSQRFPNTLCHKGNLMKGNVAFKCSIGLKCKWTKEKKDQIQCLQWFP